MRTEMTMVYVHITEVVPIILRTNLDTKWVRQGRGAASVPCYQLRETNLKLWKSHEEEVFWGTADRCGSLQDRTLSLFLPLLLAVPPPKIGGALVVCPLPQFQGYFPTMMVSCPGRNGDALRDIPGAELMVTRTTLRSGLLSYTYLLPSILNLNFILRSREVSGDWDYFSLFLMWSHVMNLPLLLSTIILFLYLVHWGQVSDSGLLGLCRPGFDPKSSNKGLCPLKPRAK